MFPFLAEATPLSEKQWGYWHKLLHYRKNLLGQFVSEVDSKDFFLTEKGKSSPKDELEAFMESLGSPQAQTYVCRFPLRYRWLKQNVKNSWKFTTESCTVYNSFVEKLDARNLSLVFSSFYVNNPGSTFGHTFIRIGRNEGFRTNELLDYAINFAAADSKDNVLLYMLKGLTGFYPGTFSVVPYYYKIREYNDHEFRDIWDYDLGLNQEQINRVIDHVWELGPTFFDYFYFTENCSYHILGLLNVAYDDVDIMQSLSPLYILPIDTVKKMKKLGLITDRKVRVSAYRKLLKETEDLSTKGLHLVKQIAENPREVKKLISPFSERKAADILDASINALDYLKAEEVLLNDEKVTHERQELLVARAENPHISEELRFDANTMDAPDDSHGSSRLGIFAGDRYKDGAFTGFEWRAAQHELLDPSQGQLKNAQVTMFDLKVRYQTVHHKTNNWILDRFRIIDLKKYQASDFWNSSISWDLGVGLDQRRECQSRNCLNPAVTFGVGNSVALGEDVIITLLFGGSYLRERIYENDSLLNLGPKLNFLILKDHFSLGLDAGYFMPTELFDGWLRRRISYDLDFRYFLRRNTALFLKTSNLDQDVGTVHEGQVGVYFYH